MKSSTNTLNINKKYVTNVDNFFYFTNFNTRKGTTKSPEFSNCTESKS